jgi:hypothetical protein
VHTTPVSTHQGTALPSGSCTCGAPSDAEDHTNIKVAEQMGLYLTCPKMTCKSIPAASMMLRVYANALSLSKRRVPSKEASCDTKSSMARHMQSKHPGQEWLAQPSQGAHMCNIIQQWPAAAANARLQQSLRFSVLTATHKKQGQKARATAQAACQLRNLPLLLRKAPYRNHTHAMA